MWGHELSVQSFEFVTFQTKKFMTLTEGQTGVTTEPTNQENLCTDLSFLWHKAVHKQESKGFI